MRFADYQQNPSKYFSFHYHDNNKSMSGNWKSALNNSELDALTRVEVI